MYIKNQKIQENNSSFNKNINNTSNTIEIKNFDLKKQKF